MAPAPRAATDELGYWGAAGRVVVGEQDAFWPPLTGWIAGFTRLAIGTDSIAAVRLLWVVMSVASLVPLRAFTRAVGRELHDGDRDRTEKLVFAVSIGFALYPPSVAYAQLVTSETPACALVLVAVALLASAPPRALASAAAGVAAGAAALARTGLGPLVVAWPLARWITSARSERRGAARRAMLATCTGIVVLAGGSVLQHRETGRIALPDNGAHNLYLGNREVYLDDLNLLDPRATPQQMAARRAMRDETAAAVGEEPALDQRGWAAARAIRDRPGRFAWRAVGRAARMFAPKTDVLELAGGEPAVGLASPAALTLLVATNLAWLVVLFGGLFGWLSLRRRTPIPWAITLATCAAAIPAPLVAIAKPRYAFVLEPLLLVGAVVLLSAPRPRLAALTRPERVVGLALAAFLAWGWCAWTIFAFSSRAG